MVAGGGLYWEGALTTALQNELDGNGCTFKVDARWVKPNASWRAKNGKQMPYRANDGLVEAGAAIGN